MENQTPPKPRTVSTITIETEGQETMRVDAVSYMLVGISAEGLEIHRTMLGSAPKLIGLATEAIEQIRMFVDNDRAAQLANKIVSQLAAVQVQLSERNGSRIAVS